MKRLLKLTGAMVTALALGLASTATGQESLSKDEKEFLKKAAEMGTAEVEMGKLAEQKAQNPQLKQAGAKLVTDHSKSNEELMKLAQQKGVQIKPELSQAQRREMGSLAKQSGAEFDKGFAEQQVKDHKKAIREFEKIAKDAKDPDVKAFATKQLPHLQDHMAAIQSAGGQRTTEAAPGQGTQGTGRQQQPAGGRVRTQ